MQQEGISSLVWERGEAWPRKSRSAWIQSPLAVHSKLVSRQLRASHAIEPPPWFQELVEWFRLRLDYDVSWSHCLSYISQVTVIAEVFQKWLTRVDCKLLIIDCWYSRLGMAATLAARRIGLTSIDMQHGRQSSSHVAYNGWLRIPQHGYETIPDVFWFWGSSDADSFRETSNIRAKCIVGGNLWLDQWRRGTSRDFQPAIDAARGLICGFDRTVLVSFDLPLEFHFRLLNELIAQSPSTWC